MILGLGNDLCDIRRIEAMLARHGQRFVARTFTEAERTQAEARPHAQRPSFYAKRFAAKEACAKALGTGFRDGIFLRHIEVVSDPAGRPSLVLTEGAAKRLTALVPPGMEARLDLSISDEYPLAQAVVIISAQPGADGAHFVEDA